MLFEFALWRFACSGTLLLLYGITEMLSRRIRVPAPAPARPAPRWLNAAGAASLTVFYCLIGPTGGAIAGGLGNAAGIALALIAMGARFAARRHTGPRRHAATAARMLFYTALPLAVGVPWGWMALTLPAYALAAWHAVPDRRRLEAPIRES